MTSVRKREFLAYHSVVDSLLITHIHSGYVQQMDTHLPTTTVREALLFSAKMRQPKNVPDSEKEA